MVSMSSCELLEDEVTDSCSADAALEQYQDALTAFSNNPTNSTCRNLKSKANAFIDKAEQCGGYDASQAHSYINQIDCSDF